MKCSKYSAGDLKEAVCFQRMIRTQDGAGGWAELWVDIPNVPTRAMVRQLSGSEVWRFSRVDAEVALMVVTRYTDNLTPADRVLIRGLTHNIREVRNVDFDNKWLEIAVKGGVAT